MRKNYDYISPIVCLIGMPICGAVFGGISGIGVRIYEMMELPGIDYGINRALIGAKLGGLSGLIMGAIAAGILISKK